MSLLIENPKRRFEYPKTYMLDHFWEDVSRGYPTPVSDDEARKIVDKIWHKERPLTPLSDKEADFIRKEAWGSVKRHLGYLDYLSGPAVFLPSEQRIGWEVGPLILTDGYAKHAHEEGRPYLSPEEKRKFYTDLNLFHSLDYIYGEVNGGSCRQGLPSQGIRKFFHTDSNMDSYGDTKEEFSNIVSQVSQKLGRKIRILDVGFGNGRALAEIKAFEAELPKITFETVGIGVDEELANWPIDETHFFPAERMPARWRESFGIIISNVAFRYFAFPEIGLENVLQALAVGGYAGISFSYDRSPAIDKFCSQDEFVNRMKVQWKRFYSLITEGYISLLDNNLSKNWDHPLHGWFSIIKNKSIPRLDR